MPRPMSRTAIAAFFDALAQQRPDPRTELEYSSHFELLAAVLLSAQATDASVNRATRVLFAVANTPQAMLELGLEKLEGYLSSLNLYRSKARHLLQSCRILVDEHDGQVPANRAALEALPGVGRKTANVVLNVAFGQPTMAVDTHIFRVSNRTGLAAGATVLEVEHKLLGRIPADRMVLAHHWLILLGRYTCKARRAECWHCPVRDVCNFSPKTPAPPATSAKSPQ